MQHTLTRALALVVFLGLQGCAGGSSGGSADSTASPAAGSATAAAVADSGKPVYGGQLRVGGVASADTMLPIFAHTEGSIYDIGFLYDALINVDPDFNIVPWLAKSWEISKDGLTYTFHMRKDAVWSDGVPLTADDQVFEYQLTTNPATGAPYRSDYDEVRSVTAPDKYTVVYRLAKPNAAFLVDVPGSSAHAPFPRHIYGKIPPAKLHTMDFSKNLVSSSGYTLKEWRHDDHLLMESNPKWWHGKPYINEIYVKEYQSNPAALIALQHGDVDTAFFLTTPMWLALKDNPQYHLVHNPSDTFNQFVVNMKNPILSDLNVRKAIMYGWDRKTEADKLYHGQDVPAVSPIPWAQKWAFDTATENAYAFDPAKAKQILDADGWSVGPDGYRQKNGKTLQFVTGEIAGSDITVQSFELFQANMKDIGIKTDMTQLEFNVFYQKEQQGDFDLDAGGFGGGADPDPSIFLSSKSFSPNGLNYGRYSDPEMDRLIEAGRREPDRAKRAVIYKELQARFVAQLPNLVDNMPYYRNVMNKRILGFDPAKAGSQFSSMMFYQPEWWIAQ
jgi:peptide/nickel transport system substrate-binding protein